MTLRLTLNIGTPDAQRLGLKKTLAGETVDVDEPTARYLLSRGWAVEDTGGGPSTIKTVPVVPLTTSAQLPPGAGAVRLHDGEPVASAPPGVEPVEAPTPTSDAPADATPDLTAMNKTELVEYAAGLGLETDGLTKAQLVEAIEEHLTK